MLTFVRKLFRYGATTDSEAVLPVSQSQDDCASQTSPATFKPEDTGYAETQEAKKGKSTKTSASDSGYSSQSSLDDNHGLARPKHNILRQLGQRFSKKFKKMWDGASATFNEKAQSGNRDENEVDEEDENNNGEGEGEADERKRNTHVIAGKIQQLSFDEGGMAIWGDDEAPVLGPLYSWECNESDKNKAREQKPFKSTTKYASPTMFEQYKTRRLAGLAPEHIGIEVFFGILLRRAVFKPVQPETFTIHHTDLDLQNILVDDDGDVTGIIGWDGAFIAPRCMDAGAVPLFLQKDWMPDYLNNLNTSPCMGWKTPHYREIYAAALMEAGCSDAIYTTKSPIYYATLSAVQHFNAEYMDDLVHKLLREVPHVRVDSVDFRRALGRGWDAAEEMLEVELAKILKPELPRTNLLEELDADIALKEWYLNFNLDGDQEEEDDADDNTDDFDTDEVDDHDDGDDDDHPDDASLD